MRILHSLAESKGGLYPSSMEILNAERDLGHDAFPVDPNAFPSERFNPSGDSAWPIGSAPWNDCDVIVDHSGVSKGMFESGVPIVHIRHARPKYTFERERTAGVPVFSHLKNISEGLSAVVAFLRPDVPFWEWYLKRKVFFIPPPVDLVKWAPSRAKKYKFGGKGGSLNVVCAEVWREDVNPFEVISGFGMAKLPEGSKLHLYGLSKQCTARDTLTDALGDRLGEEMGRVDNLDAVYRAADMVISPHRVATRTIREAMACGCPVLGANGNEYATFHGDVSNSWEFSTAIEEAVDALRVGDYPSPRGVAVESFNPKDTAEALMAIATEVVHGTVNV